MRRIHLYIGQREIHCAHTVAYVRPCNAITSDRPPPGARRRAAPRRSGMKGRKVRKGVVHEITSLYIHSRRRYSRVGAKARQIYGVAGPRVLCLWIKLAGLSGYICMYLRTCMYTYMYECELMYVVLHWKPSIDSSLPGNNREYLVMFLEVESDLLSKASTKRAFSQFGIFGG